MTANPVILCGPIENIQEIHQEMIRFIHETLKKRRYQLLPLLCDFHLRDVYDIEDPSFSVAIRMARAYQIAASNLRDHPIPGEGDRILRDLQTQFEHNRRGALYETMIRDQRELLQQRRVCEEVLSKMEEKVNHALRCPFYEIRMRIKNAYKTMRANYGNILHNEAIYLAFFRNIMLIKIGAPQ